MASICISLVTNDVEHLFLHLSDISVSLVKYLFKYFARFFPVGLFVLLLCKRCCFLTAEQILCQICLFSRAVTCLFGFLT